LLQGSGLLSLVCVPKSSIPNVWVKKIQNKIQPLLVYFRQVEQAKLILSSAHQLCESHDAHTKRNLHINENLTKAAARVTYELRCLLLRRALFCKLLNFGGIRAVNPFTNMVHIL